MTQNSGFVAYPGEPSTLGVEIEMACRLLAEHHALPAFTTWRENDIAGRFLIDPILEKIRGTDLLVADVSRLNFNVAFEIGFAIGSSRRVMLVRRSDVVGDSSLFASLGIFDTLGYNQYTSGADLAQMIIAALRDVIPLKVPVQNTGRPRLFLLESPTKASYDISLLSAIKKSRVGFERYDPTERGRFAAGYAIDSVSKENAFVARLLPKDRELSLIHNIRVAFCAGIAHALAREFLLFQESEDPVPLDYRDLVRWVPDPKDISQKIGDLVLRLYAEQESVVETKRPATIIANLDLGSSIAENESRQLSSYYLHTDSFRHALRGDVQLVIGRKGAGKTAFFLELRNSLRRNPNNVILDLQPEGFQILKFKEKCLSLLSVGSREHLLTALWEYVILLEIAYRILREDRLAHVYNHLLNKPYYALNAFLSGGFLDSRVSEDGDFSERLDRVLLHVEEKLLSRVDVLERDHVLSNPAVTEILYTLDLRQLQQLVRDYISHKAGLWVLVDNLDKGWPATGVSDDDVRIIRCLQAALHKIEKPLLKSDVSCHGIVFLRSDVYEHLVAATPDKGKLRKVSLDLSNREILREILRLRIVHSIGKKDISLDSVWPEFMISHIKSTAEETCEFMIQRSLMRPRCFLDLIQACVSNAVTLGHDKVTEADLKEGLSDYSVELATNIGFEIRDVFQSGPEIIYELLGSRRRLAKSELDGVLGKYPEGGDSKFFTLLLWYGVLGLVDREGEAKYIYDERYEMQKLLAVHKDVPKEGDPMFEINPAFWAALEIDVLN